MYYTLNNLPTNSIVLSTFFFLIRIQYFEKTYPLIAVNIDLYRDKVAITDRFQSTLL